MASVEGSTTARSRPAVAATLITDIAVQDWRPVLETITIPTLVIGGESSLFSPTATAIVAATIPGAHFEVLSASEHGSHLAYLESPNRVNEIIDRFLEQPSHRPVSPSR